MSTMAARHESVLLQGQHPGHSNHHHAVQFYSDDKFLLEELSHYIGDSLRAGEAAIVVATEQHREGLMRWLGAQGLDVAGPVEQGRLVVVDASKLLATFMVDGWPDQSRFSNVIGGVIDRARSAALQGSQFRVAIYGEMVALLWAQGNTEAAIHLEQLWNGLARSNSFSLFCAYPMSGFSREQDGELLARVCLEHSAVIPTESYTELASEEDRLRTVAQLQQKARALETEVAEHKRLRQELEAHVEARTAELQSSNMLLLEQIRKRQGAETSLRTLTSQLMLIRDEERRRVARELHESTAQVLATLAINLSLLQEPERPVTDRDSNLIEQSAALVERLLTEVRHLSDTLHPPTLDEMGLASAIHWYVDRFTRRCDLKVTVEIAEDLGRFAHEKELAAFRVVQESLSDVQRHSGSRAATVRISRPQGHICVQVSDQGKGLQRRLNPFSSGVGISGMRERVHQLGGLLNIHCSDNETVVTAELPI